MLRLSLKTAYKMGTVAVSKELKSRLFPEELDHVSNYGSSVALVFTEKFQESKLNTAKMMMAAGKNGFIPLYDTKNDEVFIYSKDADFSKHCGCGSIGPPHNEQNGFVGCYGSHPGQILV